MLATDKEQLKNNYEELGYFVIRNYFTIAEISLVRETILKFHELWKQDNVKFYQEEAFNSSLITGSEYLAADDRIKLFNFISSKKMMDVMRCIVSIPNTQYPIPNPQSH